jgi:hypothetical protein
MDLFEKEVGLAVAATAALMSPRARHLLRRGAVYGVAGAMSLGETMASTARRVGGDDGRVTSSNGSTRPGEAVQPRAEAAEASGA